VAEALEERGSLDGDFHVGPRSPRRRVTRGADQIAPGAAQARRGKKVARPAGFGKVPRRAVDKSRTRL
jgi:hypothetical protein